MLREYAKFFKFLSLLNKIGILLFKHLFIVLVLLYILLGVYALEAPTVTSLTHPDPDLWHNSSSIYFSWEAVEGATKYACEIDQNSDTTPDDSSTCEGLSYAVPIKTDGIWYFHIKAGNGSEWGSTTHYQLKIDRTIPHKPPNVSAAATEDGGIMLGWDKAYDGLSGIKGYTIFRNYLFDFDIRDISTVEVAADYEGTTYKDENLTEGVTYHYKIRAIDNAGNIGPVSFEVAARTLTFCDLEIDISSVWDREADTLLIEVSSIGGDMYRVALYLELPDSTDVNLVEGVRESTITATYDLNQTTEGTIKIKLTSEDNDGDSCNAEQIFVYDTISPEGEWMYPEEDSTISEEVELKIRAGDVSEGASGIKSVEFYYEKDDVSTFIGEADRAADDEYIYDWNTTTVDNARYTLRAKIIDFAENSVEETTRVKIYNTTMLRSTAQEAIETAELDKNTVLEYKQELISKNISMEKVEEVIAQADANLNEAKRKFDRGVDYERAQELAEIASTTYNNAKSVLTYELFDSDEYSIVERKIKKELQAVGLSQPLIEETLPLIIKYNIKRRLEILKISEVDSNSAYYRANIILRVENNDRNAIDVQLIEVIPKELFENTSEIVTNQDYKIIIEDPIIKIEFETIRFGKEAEFVYSLPKNMNETDATQLITTNIIDAYEAPPIVLNRDSVVDASSFAQQFDFIALLAPILSLLGEGNIETFLISGGVILIIVLILITIILAVAITFFVLLRRR